METHNSHYPITKLQTLEIFFEIFLNGDFIMKKLFFCLLLLDTVTVCAKFQPADQVITSHVKEADIRLSHTINEKWTYIKEAILLPIRQSEENMQLRLGQNFKNNQNATDGLADLFLGECN